MVEHSTPQGSYSLSNLFSINYFTGRLNVSLPLTMMRGRGEAKLPINLGSSNNWELQQVYGPSNLCPNGVSCTTYNPILQQIGPQTGTYSYGVQFGADEWLRDARTSVIQGMMTNVYSVTRLYYYTPDGSSTELVTPLTADNRRSHSVTRDITAPHRPPIAERMRRGTCWRCRRG
jgi:hypothetical protein